MSRIDQFTLDMGDGAPPIVSYDSKTAKPYDADGNPPMPKPRKRRTGSDARDGAIDQVTENERRAWRELHDKELAAFLIEREGHGFIAEDFRRWFIARGNEAPHHPNVWGAMWMAATRHGLLAKTGHYRHMQDVRSHARITTEWMKPHGLQQL